MYGGALACRWLPLLGLVGGPAGSHFCGLAPPFLFFDNGTEPDWREIAPDPERHHSTPRGTRHTLQATGYTRRVFSPSKQLPAPLFARREQGFFPEGRDPSKLRLLLLPLLLLLLLPLQPSCNLLLRCPYHSLGMQMEDGYIAACGRMIIMNTLVLVTLV